MQHRVSLIGGRWCGLTAPVIGAEKDGTKYSKTDEATSIVTVYRFERGAFRHVRTYRPARDEDCQGIDYRGEAA